MEGRSVFISGLMRWILWCKCMIGCCWTKKEELTTTRIIEVGAEAGGEHNKLKTSRYTLLTFLPKNLAEQFQRVILIYFVIVTVIAYVIDSPVSPLTSIVPLSFMVLVTAVKNGYEDWLRHQADNTVNNQIVEIIQNGVIKKARLSTIAPGTLVLVTEGMEVPADLVLLCSEGIEGKCFVTTANLDGDTNLKSLRVPSPLVRCTPEVLPQGIRVEIPNPTADLYTFYGKLDIPGKDSILLSTDKLMLRGSRIMNTEWAVGCAIYTGEETKLALNAKYVSNKYSSCEAAANRYLYLFIGLIILAIVASYIAKRYIDVTQQSRDLYLGMGAIFPQPVSGVLQDVFSYLLLYYYIIPMSLFVTIELYKFLGALYIGWDVELRCKETGKPAIANTSDLNQELGQVEILFSDKTGTLTKNIMAFKACSIKGDIYEESKKLLYHIGQPKVLTDTGQVDVRFFFTILALCHTAQISTADMRRLGARFFEPRETRRRNMLGKQREITSLDVANGNVILHNSIPTRYKTNNTIIDVDGKLEDIEYQASSPDEKALVEAAHRFGVTFVGEEGNNIFVQVGSDTETYERLQLVEFTSERNRMSVIVRDENGKIWLFCKGLESSVFPLCHNTDLIEETNRHIHDFATKGHRTLAIAYREIPEEEYEQVCESMKKQTVNSVEELEQMTLKFRLLEHELTLIGATAVEDYLQDDVAEAIEALRSAGIRVWVLTGDKVETTINVAQSCAYISENARQMFIIGVEDDSAIEAHLEEFKKIIAEQSQQELALIVDGTSINQILDKPVAKTFAEISLKCNAVLCCRLTPIQKAKIVKLIKNSPGRPITAAIGDGANDISMIQEAHVGFGIFGREGHQAARSADYSFTKFSMLKKILLVMGHWYYQRFATLIHYSYYKNLVLGNLMLFYQINCAFSTQSIYDSMYLTIYNLFTALPCMVLSVTEQRWPADMLLSNPILYRHISKNRLMSWWQFVKWLLVALYHSGIIYIGAAMAVRHTVINADMMSLDLWSFGAVLYHLLVLIVNLKLWLEARYHTAALAASVVLSVLVYIACNAAYAAVNVNIHGAILGTYTRLLSSLTFWLLNLVLVVAALAPDFLCRYLSDRRGRVYYESDTRNAMLP